ncbi:MAG: hypothetical protein FJ210_05485 [Betaproteobacteria bacterium]|nr:hypothetical protein [Betaproteobacteria bacterium]
MDYVGVVWVPVGANIRHALPWLPPVPPQHEGSIYLPFLKLEGDGASFDCSERSLLFAGLIHYSCNGPLLVPAINQPYLREVLLLLAKGFGTPDLEELCMNVAASIRHDFGNGLSRLALRAGMTLRPDSSPIKSDFLVDTWCRLQTGDPENRPELALEAIEVFPGLIKEDIFPGAWEACLLTYIIALAILSRWADAEAAYATHRETFSDPEDRAELEWMLAHRAIDMERLAQPSLGCRE